MARVSVSPQLPRPRGCGARSRWKAVSSAHAEWRRWIQHPKGGCDDVISYLGDAVRLCARRCGVGVGELRELHLDLPVCAARRPATDRVRTLGSIEWTAGHRAERLQSRQRRWHAAHGVRAKDNAYYNSGTLSREFGTWNPSQTGSALLNRPYDSYLTIGGAATPANTTSADPSWVSGGHADARGWDRPDLPTNGSLGWFNSNPPNLQGRVGTSGNTATDVRLGQFVRSASDSSQVSLSLTIGYNNGVPGSAVQFATSIIFCPSPAAAALFALLGVKRSRRR